MYWKKRGRESCHLLVHSSCACDDTEQAKARTENLIYVFHVRSARNPIAIASQALRRHWSGRKLVSEELELRRLDMRMEHLN